MAYRCSFGAVVALCLLVASADAAQLRAGVGSFSGLKARSSSGNSTSATAEARPLPLVFKHLSKIAGTYVIDLLNTVMGKGKWNLVDEMFALTDARKGDGFVISSARNPCDYYVSLWAFDSTKNFALFSMQDGGSEFFAAENKNATKFQNWLAWTQSHGTGIMSYRLYETLVGLKDGMSCWDQELGFCGEKFDNKKVEAGLAAWSPNATADCWVHTENLMGDLRRCLKMYESASGTSIDWDVFDDYDAGRSALKSKGNHNPSDHQHCSYYFDNATAASVMKRDRYLFEAFGYDTCCGAAKAGAMK